MGHILLALALGSVFDGGLQAPTPASVIVSGQIMDATSLPLPGVVISVRGIATLTVSDEQGHFVIEARVGSTLVVELPGFTTRELAVTPASLPLTITLVLAPLTSDVIVRASAAPAVPSSGQMLRPIDIVRTAGAQADVMRAVGTLPGVTAVDEGAGLFVRGGDVSETRVLYDGAVLNHPYRYETPTGGFRGAVDPFLTSGVSFSTGGFSAAYGNSLSGVLDLQGLGRPAAVHGSATVGLAGVSASGAAPLGTRAGVRVAANRATPGLLFAVNPSPREFDLLPQGWDISGSGHLELPYGGSARVFWLVQRDVVGVRLEQDAFDGFLHASARHQFLTVAWKQPLSRGWSASTVAGTDRYTNGTDVGVFDVDLTDIERSARVDLIGPVGRWVVRTGMDAGVTSATATGVAPTKGEDFGGVGGTVVYDVRHQDVRIGAFAESTRTFGRVTPTVGVRADRYDHSGASRVDPRASLLVDLGSNRRLRLAWGRFHQAPSARYFDTARGESALGPMAATHYIVGFEQGLASDAWFFRVEAYLKTYADLPVDDGQGTYGDDGYGYARGLDVFVRRIWHFVDVRASASLLDAARRWTSPDQRDRYPLPAGTWTPDFAVPFTWQVNATIPVWKTVSVAASWRMAAGRPFTPAVGAVPTEAGFEPIWGPINSERLPPYSRFDLAVSHTRPLGAHGLAVFFASLDNVTGRLNFFEYAYSADYVTRRPVLSAAPRSVYVGCSITR